MVIPPSLISRPSRFDLLEIPDLPERVMEFQTIHSARAESSLNTCLYQLLLSHLSKPLTCFLHYWR